MKIYFRNSDRWCTVVEASREPTEAEWNSFEEELDKWSKEVAKDASKFTDTENLDWSKNVVEI